MTPDSLRATWAVLSRPSSGRLTSYVLDVRAHGSHVRVALDELGRRHILVPLGPETVPSDTRPAVLAMQQRRLTFGDETHEYLDVACYNSEVFDEFDDVVADVLAAVGSTDEPANAAVGAVARWRRLFQAIVTGRLDKQRRLGLFAELVVLREVTLHGGHLSSWTGPEQAPHDFELPNGCLEVKGLMSADARVQIHGLQQLQTHEGRPLTLVLVLLSEDEGGVTLSELISELRPCLPAEKFTDRLTRSGWHASTVDAGYERLLVQAVTCVPVTDGVPRLTADQLLQPPDPAIEDVSYKLAAAVLQPHATASSLQALVEQACP